MGMTRHDSLKIKRQCETCKEREGTTCALGFSIMCKRQSTKACPHYGHRIEYVVQRT